MTSTPGALEVPSSSDELYLARGTDVSPSRPELTGDVFCDVEIPGLGGEAGLAIVLTHPCSMRTDGVNLAERVVVTRVAPHVAINLAAWTGHARVMPLPELELSDKHYAARFDSLGVIAGTLLQESERIACLSERGINLLQQRFIFSLTRFVVPTSKLHTTCEAVFREVEMCEEWVTTATEHEVTKPDALAEFHGWIRDTDGAGVRRQDRLSDPQNLGTLNRELRAACLDRYCTSP